MTVRTESRPSSRPWFDRARGLSRRMPAAVLLATVAMAVAATHAAATPTTPASTTPASTTPASTTPAVEPSSIGGPLMASTGIVVGGPAGTTPPPAVSAAGYVLADADTGAVLAAKDPHGRFLPASTLKTLTALTLIPRLDAQHLVVASNAAAAVDGSKVGVVPGMRYRVRDLFTALLVVSGNDAALTLADAYGGVPATVTAMNAEAKRLQALDTTAVNPHGLDAKGQLTSAYDLALIARAGLRLPDFRAYASTLSAHFPAPHGKAFEIYNHNKMLTHYRGAIGIKTGYTDAARATFVGAATRGDRTLIVTLMHADPYCWKEAEKLLDWGFAQPTGQQPAGVLVDPTPPPGADRAAATASPSPSSTSTRSAARPLTAATRSSGRSAGLSRPMTATAVGVVAGAVILTLAAQLRARRHRRYRPRLRLPKL